MFLISTVENPGQIPANLGYAFGGGPNINSLAIASSDISAAWNLEDVTPH